MPCRTKVQTISIPSRRQFIRFGSADCTPHLLRCENFVRETSCLPAEPANNPQKKVVISIIIPPRAWEVSFYYSSLVVPTALMFELSTLLGETNRFI